jgi:hypothetical protein
MDFENLLNFERASVATYYDADGVLQTAAINEPRLDHDPVTLEPLGLLVEEGRTNILLNSDLPADQSVTLTAGQYTLSAWGAGSVSVGAYGSANDGTPLTFTATAGSESIVITGDLDRFQLEAGGFATSYIPTTGAPATRSPDICSVKSVDPWIDQNEGTLYVQLNKKAGSYVGNYLTLSDGTASNQVVIKDRSVFYKETNYMPSPFDPSSWSGASDPDLSYTSVTEVNPSGESFVGEFEYLGPASMSITESSYISATAGDFFYTCIMFKPSPIKYFRFFLQKNNGGTVTTEELTTFNGETGTFLPGSTDPDDAISVSLNDGYYILQVKYTAQESLPYRAVVYCDGDFFFNPPSIGDKVYLQAAFFGKANDWPAIISDANVIQTGTSNLTGVQSFAAPLENGESKLALSYDGSTYSAAKDGVAFSGVNAGVPALTDLYIGSGEDGSTRYFNGHIIDAQYFPRILDESELVDLTT